MSFKGKAGRAKRVTTFTKLRRGQCFSRLFNGRPHGGVLVKVNANCSLEQNTRVVSYASDVVKVRACPRHLTRLDALTLPLTLAQRKGTRRYIVGPGRLP